MGVRQLVFSLLLSQSTRKSLFVNVRDCLGYMYGIQISEALYRVCGLAVTAGIAMKFGTAHGRSRLGVGGAKCIGSNGRKGVPPAPCNFGAS